MRRIDATRCARFKSRPFVASSSRPVQGRLLRRKDLHARHHRPTARIEHPRGGQCRPRAQRRAGLLVRRERRGHARAGPPGGRRSRCCAARPSTRTTWACPSCATAWPTYIAALHGPVGVERIAVTSSGVTALMLAMQMLAGRRRRGGGGRAGVAQPDGAAADPRRRRCGASRCARARARGRSTWTHCCAAVTPRTRVLLVNAPNNPTGWTLTRAEQQAHPGPLPPHRHLDRRRRGLRAHLVRRRARRAELPGHRRAATTDWWWRTASPRAS